MLPNGETRRPRLANRVVDHGAAAFCGSAWRSFGVIGLSGHIRGGLTEWAGTTVHGVSLQTWPAALRHHHCVAMRRDVPTWCGHT